MAETLLEIPNW